MTDVQAYVTGTVWKVHVQTGDTVVEGQELAIIESMKMEFPVQAPVAGHVAELRVAAEQPVTKGDVMIVIAN